MVANDIRECALAFAINGRIRELAANAHERGSVFCIRWRSA